MLTLLLLSVLLNTVLLFYFMLSAKAECYCCYFTLCTLLSAKVAAVKCNAECCIVILPFTLFTLLSAKVAAVKCITECCIAEC